jgi:O-antigen/teichoic acid export membrane protein
MTTKPPSQDVQRHISHTVVLRVVNTILLMLQSVFLTRLLGPQGRGLLAKLQASQNFFILFLGIGVTAALSHYLSSKRFEDQKVLGVAFLVWVAGVTSLLGLQILSFYFPSIELIFPRGYVHSFFEFYFFASFALNFLQTIVNAALMGRHRFALTNWLEILAAVLRVAVFGAYFFSHLLGRGEVELKTLFEWDLALTVLRAATFCFGYLREFGLKLNLRGGQIFRPVLHFSLMIYISSVINFLYLRLDFWLTERKLGLAALGVYATASGLAQFLTFVPMTLNTVMLPHLSATNEVAAVNKLRLFSSLSATAVVAMASVLILFASPLIHVLYGDSFTAAILPLRIITVSFAFLSFKHLFVFYNISQNRAKKNIEAELCGLLIGVGFNLMLMPSLGTVGASIASLAANGFSFLYVVKSARLPKDMPILHFFMSRSSDLKNLLRSLAPKEALTH